MRECACDLKNEDEGGQNCHSIQYWREIDPRLSPTYDNSLAHEKVKEMANFLSSMVDNLHSYHNLNDLTSIGDLPRARTIGSIWSRIYDGWGPGMPSQLTAFQDLKENLPKRYALSMNDVALVMAKFDLESEPHHLRTTSNMILWNVALKARATLPLVNFVDFRPASEACHVDEKLGRVGESSLV
jgi:hypothetical protein